jgi:hypothetical protein
VRVEFTGNIAMQIRRNAAGQILIGSQWCDGATVENTDTIYVIGDDRNQHVNLWLHHGGFKPGKTNEPGSSDEIEIALYFSGGTDWLSISGSPQTDDIRFGHPTTGFAVGRVNLNAAESTGVDGDVSLMAGAETVAVSAGDGPDDVSGAGGVGTGEEFTLPMSLHGNDGADALTGGTVADVLYGDKGGDTLKGRGGNDFLDAEDDVSGNDTANGGAGVDDTCFTDPGDTEINC